MKSRLATILTGLLVLTMVLSAGCSAKPAATEAPAAEATAAAPAATEAPAAEAFTTQGKVIGVTLWDMRQQYFLSMAEGIKAAAEEYGITINLQDQENDSGRQNTQIENFITMGVDGMIICAIDGEAADTLVKQAAEQGIPTVAEGIEIKSAATWQNWIEYDYGYTVGKMAAEWINKTYPNEEKVICGVIGESYSKQLIDRTNGIKDGLTQNSDKAVIVDVQDSYSMEDAIKITENWIQEYPEMRVICGIDDDNGGLGANEALNAVVAPEDRAMYGVFGADGVAEARARIKEGGCYKGTVDIDPYGQGYNCVELMIKLWKGEPVDAFTLVDSSKTITTENIDDYID